MICHSIDRLDRSDWLSREGSARFAIVSTASRSFAILLDFFIDRRNLFIDERLNKHVGSINITEIYAPTCNKNSGTAVVTSAVHVSPKFVNTGTRKRTRLMKG